MRILIDTHILIWHLEDHVQLSLQRSDIIEDSDNEILVSVASLWEIAIKLSLNKLNLSRSVDDIIRAIDASTGSWLTIDPKHLTHVAQLPFHHKDPFDRLIIAQAIAENLPIISSDPNFANYGVKVL